MCLTFVSVLSLWADSAEISSHSPSYLTVRNKSFKEAPGFSLNALFVSEHNSSFLIPLIRERQRWPAAEPQWWLAGCVCVAVGEQVMIARWDPALWSSRLLFELATLFPHGAYTRPAAAQPCCLNSVQTRVVLGDWKLRCFLGGTSCMV